MYAVIDIKGFQYKIEKGDTLKVPRFDKEVGEEIDLSDVLLVSDKDEVTVGNPLVEGVLVKATVTGQDRYKKIIVFKKKRRKDYQVKNGHRQDYTLIKIDEITFRKEAEAAGKKNEALVKTAETE